MFKFKRLEHQIFEVFEIKKIGIIGTTAMELSSGFYTTTFLP